MHRINNVCLAAALVGILTPALSYGGLAYGVASTSKTAQATVSSPRPTIARQQAIADPTVTSAATAANPFSDDPYSYIVAFSGSVSWVGNVVLDSQTPFSPDPAGHFTPNQLNLESARSVQPQESIPAPVDTGSVSFSGSANGFDPQNPSANLPPNNVLTDTDFITVNFDTDTANTPANTIPMVLYTVNFDDLTVYDSLTGQLIDLNPNNTTFNPFTTETGSPDTAVAPEPTAALLAGAGALGLLLQRRGRNRAR